MSRPSQFAFFTSSIGTCAVAWNDVGLTGVWLPDASDAALRRKLARRLPTACESPPPAAVARAIEAIRQAIDGVAVDLREIALDLDRCDPFQRRVYAVARAIAPGRVLTYAAVAERVGADASARAVGAAMGANPFPIVVPCHRVVAASGQLGGFSAPGGVALKRRLLAREDARLEGPDLFEALGEGTTDAVDAR